MRLSLVLWSICVLWVLSPYQGFGELVLFPSAGLLRRFQRGYGFLEFGFEGNEGRGCVGCEVLSRAVGTREEGSVY